MHAWTILKPRPAEKRRLLRRLDSQHAAALGQICCTMAVGQAKISSTRMGLIEVNESGRHVVGVRRPREGLGGAIARGGAHVLIAVKKDGGAGVGGGYQV